MRISKSTKLSIQIAATFVGTIIGAGFATGKEIVQFFTQYGAWGTFGIIVSGILFIWVGTKIMILASIVRAKSYKDLNNHLFGPIFGKVINGLILFALLGVTAVMLSGAGAVFHEQIGFPVQMGLLITVGLCYIVVLKGLKGVIAVNTFVVPLMILFTFTILVFRLPYIDGAGLIPEFSVKSIPFHWLLSAFSYVSFNLLTAQAVLVPLGSEIRDHTAIRRGGVIGGITLTLLLLASHLALKDSTALEIFQVPMAELIRALGPYIHLLYVVIIFGEIFTTFIGNIYGLRRHVSQLSVIEPKTILVMLLAGVFMISQVGYGPLLSSLYPFFGYLGLLFMFYIMIKK